MKSSVHYFKYYTIIVTTRRLDDKAARISFGRWLQLRFDFDSTPFDVELVESNSNRSRIVVVTITVLRYLPVECYALPPPPSSVPQFRSQSHHVSESILSCNSCSSSARCFWSHVRRSFLHWIFFRFFCSIFNLIPAVYLAYRLALRLPSAYTTTLDSVPYVGRPILFQSRQIYPAPHRSIDQKQLGVYMVRSSDRPVGQIVAESINQINVALLAD